MIHIISIISTYQVLVQHQNYVAESLVPKGIKLNLQVQFSNNNMLKQVIDRDLERPSFEICHMVKEEHVAQLHESKNKLTKTNSDLICQIKENSIR